MSRQITAHDPSQRSWFAAARVTWVVLAVTSLGLFAGGVLDTLTSAQAWPPWGPGRGLGSAQSLHEGLYVVHRRAEHRPGDRLLPRWMDHLLAQVRRLV